MLSNILVIIPLIQTDLPLPVEPATSEEAFHLIELILDAPEISLPMPTSNLYLDGNLSSKTSFRVTSEILSLGTSIPTAERPGIGASIRTSFAAKANAMSLWRLTILLTLTPCAG